ncbi:hypothetical protein FHG87_015369 [Trinorchestia longiramus]|nr:hypothetical protein FHG87_015369 [Trinorchestia longiramus]
MGRHEHGANSEHIVNHRKVHHHHHESSNHHRARSLSPHRYRKQLNQPHRHSHHRFHHHHHRSSSPSRHRSPPGSPSRRRSSPPPRRRSPAASSPRRDSEQRRRFRRRSVSPRTRSRRDHRRRRRTSSNEHPSDRTPPSSPSPSLRPKAGRGNLAKLIIRLLTSSKKKRHQEEEARDTSFHSLDVRDPHNVTTSRSQNDLLPLILAREDLTDLANATMAHRNFGRSAALQRAREDEAMEVERLRKIREDAAEAERLRISTEEAAERARRTRIQMEMDEAEMRRVRALEQFNETERQRRELQLEDRLRQLEDQEMPPEPQKTGSCKKYCRAFKVSFGIFLSLGLIFVFYLIVASIMGESAPLDIFNLDQTEDPSLADITVQNPGKNLTGLNNVQNSIEQPNSDEKREKSNQSENETGLDNVSSDFDNVVINPYDTSRAYDGSKRNDQLEYGSFDEIIANMGPNDGQITRDAFGNLIIEPIESESKDGSVIVEYVDDSPLKNDETISIVALEPEISYASGEDQQFSQSNPSDISYLPPFVASNEDHFVDGNFESVHRDSDHFIAHQFPPNVFESPATPSGVTTTFDDALLERSDTSVGEYDYFLPAIHINGPIQTSFENGAIERANVNPIKDFTPTHIPSPIFAHSYEDSGGSNLRRSFETIGGGGVRVGAGGRRGERRPSLEKLESEIIETLLNIAEKDKSMNNRRLRVRPGASSRRRLRGPSRRTDASTPRRKRVDPTRRTGSRTNRPMRRLNSMRTRQSQRLPLLPLPDMRTASQSPTQLGTYLGPPPFPRSPAPEDPMKSMENSRRVQYSNHRGPRNTETHVPPPEFRYPKSAENIQDIIGHMTGEGNTPSKVAFSRQRRIPKGFKIGHQGHVLNPTFIKSSESRSKERRHTVPVRGRKVRRKTKPKIRPVLKTKPKIVRIKQDEEDEVIFNDDGSVVHISNNPPPLQYGHSVEITLKDKEPNEPPQSRDNSASYKDYSPPGFEKNKSKLKPIKVMLDVYPSPNFSDEGETPRYESNYYLEDKYDYRPINRDNFRHPSSRERYGDDTHSLEERYRSSDKRYQSPDERYRSPDERYRSPDERYRSPDERSRSQDPPRFREPYYSSREKYSNSEYRHILEDSGYDRSRIDDKAPIIQTSDNQHTITLHINLYDRKPDYSRSSRRINTSASVLRPVHVALSELKALPDRPTSEPQMTGSFKGRRQPTDYRGPSMKSKHSSRQGQSSSSHEPEPTNSDVKEAMKELGINIDLNKRFSALDVYRALIRNTRKMQMESKSRFGNNGGPVAAGLTTSKSLSEDEEASLLSAVHDALEGINSLLPKSLRFELPKSQDSSPKNSRYKMLVAKVNNDDFDYSDGFEAVVDADVNSSRHKSQPNSAFSRRMGKFMNVSRNDIQFLGPKAFGANEVQSQSELPGFEFLDLTIKSSEKNQQAQISNSGEDKPLLHSIPLTSDGFDYSAHRSNLSERAVHEPLDLDFETENTTHFSTELTPVKTTTQSVYRATGRAKFHLKTIIER